MDRMDELQKTQHEKYFPCDGVCFQARIVWKYLMEVYYRHIDGISFEVAKVVYSKLLTLIVVYRNDASI